MIRNLGLHLGFFGGQKRKISCKERKLGQTRFGVQIYSIYCKQPPVYTVSAVEGSWASSAEAAENTLTIQNYKTLKKMIYLTTRTYCIAQGTLLKIL